MIKPLFDDNILAVKTLGLSSKTRKALRHNAKAATLAANQTGYLAAKERKRSLLMQAEKAQADRQEREKQLLAVLAAKSDDINDAR